MKRNQKTSLVLLLLITILTYVFSFLFSEVVTVLADSMHITGLDIIQQISKFGGVMEEIRIDGWIKANCEYMSIQDLQRLTMELLPLLGENSLGENSQEEIRTGEIDDARQVSLTLNRDGIQTNIRFYNSSLPHDKADSWETYIVVDSIIDSNYLDKEAQIYQELQELLSQFGSEPSIITTYTGVIQGKLTTRKMEELGKGLVRNLQGRITESNKDSDWVSFTAYSNCLGGDLESEYGKFNVNVALRYHSSEGKTYIRVGTPVIAIPY